MFKKIYINEQDLQFSLHTFFDNLLTLFQDKSTHETNLFIFDCVAMEMIIADC